jgi:hypothetical protein
VRFTYTVTGGGGTFDLSRTALYPTILLEVYAADPLDLRSNRLEETEEVTVGEERYVRYASKDPIEAGDPVQVIVVAEAGSSNGLILGAAGLGVVLLVAVGFAAFRPRRRRTAADDSASPPPTKREPAVSSRQTILTAIARLDLDHEARAISDEEWETQRQVLKERLDDPGTPS